MQGQSVSLFEVAQKAPNRRKLYDALQKVYDLPNYGPMITTDYLREIMKANSRFIKVKRSDTHTIPKGIRRNFSSITTLHWLVKLLKDKNLKECSFTSYSTPNVEWMLRIIIFVDPEQKANIFKKSVEDKSDHRKVQLEDQYVDIDPQQFPSIATRIQSFSIKSIFDSQAPCRSVSNQNYRMYMDSFAQEEKRRIANVDTKIKTSQTKALKLKIAMERALQDQEDQKNLLEIYQQELELKKKKRQIHDNKKILRKRTMERQKIKFFLDDCFSSLLEGNIPQTPLVNKFLKMQMSSTKKEVPQKNLANAFFQDQEEDQNNQFNSNEQPLLKEAQAQMKQQQSQQFNQGNGFDITALQKEDEYLQTNQQPAQRKSKRREDQKKKKKERFEAMKKVQRMEIEEQRMKEKKHK